MPSEQRLCMVHWFSICFWLCLIWTSQKSSHSPHPLHDVICYKSIIFNLENDHPQIAIFIYQEFCNSGGRTMWGSKGAGGNYSFFTITKYKISNLWTRDFDSLGGLLHPITWIHHWYRWHVFRTYTLQITFYIHMKVSFPQRNSFRKIN